MRYINQRDLNQEHSFIKSVSYSATSRFSIAQMCSIKQYCNRLEANVFELLNGSRAQLKQTLTAIMVAMLFFYFFFQLISSNAVAEVSCSSCVSLFFSDSAC